MERPILFSGEMVRAILAGKKTQTRRIVKPQPIVHGADEGVLNRLFRSGGLKCPYGKPGDRLWVRETWNGFFDDEVPPNRPRGPVCGLHVPAHPERTSHIYYAADGELCHQEFGIAKWRPSIHMPKAAARIWLEVTGVRVERLQDITEDDAKAEGLEPCVDFVDDIPSCKTGFMLTWERLYGFDAWIANPWVWVIEFREAGE